MYQRYRIHMRGQGNYLIEWEANLRNTCRAPIEWETPTGKSAQVMVELQLSAFFGYGKSEEDSYLGLQAHGVLWVANPSEAPINWPIAPPIIAGKVRI